MTKHHNTIVIGVAVLISAGVWLLAFNTSKAGQYHFTAKTFNGQNGWGYEVLVNDSLFIHQDFIPLLQGKKGFATESQARQMAQLVIRKLKKGQVPSISKPELERICPINQNEYGEFSENK